MTILKLLTQRIFVQEKLLVILAVIGFWLCIAGHLSLSHVFRLVEWQTVGALFGLLILSYGLEQSGYLEHFGRHLIRRLRTERQMALFFVIASSFLAAFMTNDISLFIVVPLALAVGQRLKAFPLGRLVIFIAMAVNVGSSLTPVGNPQNLFLWQSAHVSFFHFTRVMLPLVVLLFFVLLIGVWAAFSSRSLMPHELQDVAPLDRRLLATSLVLYPLFLIALDYGYLWLALTIVVSLFLLRVRRVFRRMDWALLLIFILMFIDFKVLAALPLVHSLALQSLASRYGGYKSGVLFSQVLSNVPAAILLQSFHPSWQHLAWGVDVGGFGLAIGSLANLIALRLARIKNLWVEFHYWSLAMLGISFVVGLLLL